MVTAITSDNRIQAAREINVLRQKAKEGYIFPRYVWKTLNSKYTCDDDTRDLFSVVESKGTVNPSSHVDVEFSIFRSEIISLGLHKFRPLQNNTLNKHVTWHIVTYSNGVIRCRKTFEYVEFNALINVPDGNMYDEKILDKTFVFAKPRTL